MVRFGLAAVIALAVPAIASAEWIHTVVEASGATVNLIGHGNVTAAAWKSDFWSGTYPSPVGTYETTRFTYCVSTNQGNTATDNYNLTNITTVPGHYSSQPGLVNGLMYILDKTLAHQTGSTADILYRAAAQVAIWDLLFDYGQSSFNVGGMTASIFSTYQSLYNGAVANAAGPPPGDPSGWGFGAGPGGSNENQDMIWVDNGGGNLEGVPVPASVYGALAAFGALFATRRFFGIVA